MQTSPTAIPDVLLVEPKVYSDDRGWFCESWNRDRFREHGLEIEFVQDNHSHSVQGTLRGLHYQLQNPQGKLVRVAHGAVFDVAVDLRKSSPTFGHWVSHNLSSSNRRMMWIPPGFAHGFYVLSPTADFVYKCTAHYDAADERTVHWDDPDLAIEWPIQPSSEPLISDKDRAAPSFREAAYHR